VKPNQLVAVALCLLVAARAKFIVIWEIPNQPKAAKLR
jgi:hypothetical protein